MAEVLVRRAVPNDLPELCRLLAQLSEEPAAWDAGRSLAALEAILDGPGIHLLVAERDRSLVGTVTLVVVPNLTHDGRPWAQLENMVVDARCRSAGVGRDLLRAALHHAREAGCYKVQLQSANPRTGAHRFYEREGFAASS